MKKLFLSVMLLALAVAGKAQETPFEGEIVYETYENYSDYILKMPNSIYFNGVHKVRLILKGDWMHMIDETTGCHIIVNNAAVNIGVYVSFELVFLFSLDKYPRM